MTPENQREATQVETWASILLQKLEKVDEPLLSHDNLDTETVY
jgi:hypothetical protein